MLALHLFFSTGIQGVDKRSMCSCQLLQTNFPHLQTTETVNPIKIRVRFHQTEHSGFFKSGIKTIVKMLLETRAGQKMVSFFSLRTTQLQPKMKTFGLKYIQFLMVAVIHVALCPHSPMEAKTSWSSYVIPNAKQLPSWLMLYPEGWSSATSLAHRGEWGQEINYLPLAISQNIWMLIWSIFVFSQLFHIWITAKISLHFSRYCYMWYKFPLINKKGTS